MNLHPLFVHFPIALLTLYSCIEIMLPVKVRVFELLHMQQTKVYALVINPVWKQIKAFLVIFGTIFTIPTFLTGEIAEHRYMEGLTPEIFFESEIGKLVEAHSTLGITTIVIFSIIALIYAGSYVEKTKKVFTYTYVRVLLAILGLLAIVATGALGGTISHGEGGDPIAQTLYNLVIKK